MKAKRHNDFTRFLDEIGKTALTKREAEIGAFMVKGFSAAEISKILEISVGTARNHMKRIYSKIGVTSQAEMCGVFIEQILSSKSDYSSFRTE